MKNTENESNKKSEFQTQKQGAQTLFSESGKALEAGKDSMNLSKKLCLSLMSLIDEVNKPGVTPDSVNATCNIASQIHKILRLNFEMKKDGF
jgi:hypothetical protein